MVLIYLREKIMEKIWKEVSQNEYQKCFDILNTQSLIEKETYKNFAIELFEIAKKQLGCPNCKLKFVDNMQNNLGVASVVDNSVTLNLSKMEKQTLYKTVSTIYHELTHLRQDLLDDKKQPDTIKVAQFPFVRCVANEAFLPAEMLGINPFMFYYTCKHEKQARDVGSECAMELFVALNEMAKTKQTRTGAQRLIERCINQVQMRWDKENADYKFAASQIEMFLKQHPNFVQDTLNKIKQEFLLDAGKFGIASNERRKCESRFNARVGALVLMGCDENIKKQILDFVSANFVNSGEIFTTLVSIADSPYSKTTKNDLTTLFKMAQQVGCPKETLLSLLVSWEKAQVEQIVYGTQKQLNNLQQFKGNKFEL